MRLYLLVLVFWLLSAAVHAYDLGTLVAHQRRSYAEAVVTSGFYDPRGISRYRSRPGLHLGYDVAMPYGAAARVAWPGLVVAIVPWHGAEYGVTVQHADGSTATYGHIAPAVPVGTPLQPGDVVGTIASDHLDVKMRDSAGLPYDFGASGLRLASLVLLKPPPPVDPEPLRRRVAALLLSESRRAPADSRDLQQLQARGLSRSTAPAQRSQAAELLQAWQDYKALRPATTRWPHQQTVERRWQEAREKLERMEKLYAAGLVSRRRLEAEQQEAARRRKLADIARTL